MYYFVQMDQQTAKNTKIVEMYAVTIKISMIVYHHHGLS